MKTYEVPGHSIIQVRGRELGSQHRDMVYAIFRLPAQRIEIPALLEAHAIEGAGAAGPSRSIMIVECTWRDILEASAVTPHTNNLSTMLRLMEEIRQVSFTVFRGEEIQPATGRPAKGGRSSAGTRQSGAIAAERRRSRSLGSGFSNTLLGNLEWTGDTLDSVVTIQYADWIRGMVERDEIVSISGSYFQLRSEYAKSILPFIDSKPEMKAVDEAELAGIAGRDLMLETPRQRAKFREEVRQAFIDMVRAGGLASYHEELVTAADGKTVRFHFERPARRTSRRAIPPKASGPVDK